jgi:TPP-dependent pyruvate/acetoin dehydrogenase alpha subunit
MKISLDQKFCLKMYEQMLTIRRFEEKAIELFEHNLIWGNVHPCIGQEAVSVGVCSNLRRDDFMVNTHRGHGNCIAKGAELKLMMAELLGKLTGYCKGRYSYCCGRRNKHPKPRDRSSCGLLFWGWGIKSRHFP